MKCFMFAMTHLICASLDLPLYAKRKEGWELFNRQYISAFSFYSLFKLSTGLAMAALNDCALMVIKAIITAPAPANTNIHH